MKLQNKIIIAILSILLFSVIIYFIVKAIKKNRVQNLIDGNIVNISNGVTGTVTIPFDVGTKVSEINDALHGSMFSEDEVKAVNAILTTPKGVMKKLQADYYTVTGYNLKTDLQKYLDDAQWLSIQSQFN